MKIAKIYALFGSLILGMSFGNAMGQSIPTKDLKEALGAINQTLPQDIDEETRLDRVDGAHGEVVYYYTLVNYTYDQLDWGVVMDLVRPPAVDNYCNSSQMAAFKDNGIGLLYIYNDKNGELTGTFNIPADICEDAEG